MDRDADMDMDMSWVGERGGPLICLADDVF